MGRLAITLSNVNRSEGHWRAGRKFRVITYALLKVCPLPRNEKTGEAGEYNSFMEMSIVKVKYFGRPTCPYPFIR
jgi:hypothetical protein